MLSLRKAAPVAGVVLEDAPRPAPCQPGEVLIEVHAVGICGSDLHIADWHTPTFDWLRDKLPVTMGHEFSGTVAALPRGSTDLHLHQRVVVQPTLYCGQCQACCSAQPEHCSNLGFLGVTQDGAFTSLIKVPQANCYPIDDQVDLALAALAEPLAVAYNALQTGQVAHGATVLVLGPGTIGQGIAFQALKAGAGKVVVAGLHDPARLQTCRQLGLDALIDLASESLRAGLLRCIGEDAVDYVFEATGHPQSIADALTVLKVGGVLTCSGIHFETAQVDISQLVRKRLQIRGAYGSAHKDWLAVTQLLAQHGDALAPMVTHRLPLQQAAAGFALAKSKEASKVLISMVDADGAQEGSHAAV